MADWEHLIDRLVADGHGHRATDRDELVCGPCGGRPHAHRPGCPVLRAPVHVDTVQDRARSLALWRYWTGGLRPLWIHAGTIGGPGPAHEVDVEPCWCDPEIVGPERLLGFG